MISALSKKTIPRLMGSSCIHAPIKKRVFRPMIPADPKLIEAIILTCLEKNPIDFRKVDAGEVQKIQAAIKRTTSERGAMLRNAVTRKHFLCACLDSHGRPFGRAPYCRLWIPLRKCNCN